MTRLSLLLALAVLQVPAPLPLLQPEAFSYHGGFRVPRTAAGGDDFAAAGPALAFNPATNTLYLASRRNRVAEITIPDPVATPTIAGMPMATYVQPFADPMEGRLPEVGATGGGASLRGLAVLNGQLHGTAMIYYDATNAQRVSHFRRSLSLSTPSFQGWSSVYQATRTGWVAGWLTPVPPEWQTALGGTAVTGNCCVPIVSRTSYGPAAFAFSADAIGQPHVAATPLLYYDSAHQTLGPWSGSNPTYGATTTINGLALINGTRTAIYIGRNGTGPYCYGNGTGNPDLVGTIGPDGSAYCYDPVNSAKAPHAPPYVVQAWLYDLEDFAAVQAGQRQPWALQPYAVFPLHLPTPPSPDMGGVVYDAERRILYTTQLSADKDSVASARPLVHAFRVTLPPQQPTTDARITALESQVQALRDQLTRLIEALARAVAREQQ